ncbi:MAG TPA: type II secretion system protein GspK [Candidatus Omnitrophota bacterium]|nr:type II secretion system protein GspK [Candidatus Omnitrophota bacterium]HPT39481.1 type II secretion system protein GspK [Candidatus Omnitrophota bacterium]
MIKLSGRLIFLSEAKSRGSILIVALWSLCLLSAFAVILNYQVRQELALAIRLDQRDRLRLIAEAGVDQAIMELKSNPEKMYYCLADSWSNNPAAFKNIQVGSGEFSLTHSYPEKKSGLMQTGYGCVDEESKININKAESGVLERLFRIVLACDEIQAQELAASILDWRDEDSALSIPTGSAEDDYYTNLPFPYAAKNSAFEVLEELLLVKGFSDNVFEKIKDYVTIYGEGRVNINTANEVVLFALGLDEKIVDRIAAYRAGEDELIGTLDDNVFAAASDIVPTLSQIYQFSPSELERFNLVANLFLGVSSSNFLIKATASLTEKNSQTVFCVVKRDGKILYWRED